MTTKSLIDTARELVAGDKGLLAMDESIRTCNRRFQKAGIPQTIEYRRLYRELIVTTPGIGECLSGAILYDETIYQKTAEGILFIDILKNAGVIPGIKVDGGVVDLAGFTGEKITEGLDGLRKRLADYSALGMRFAKWRAVLTIDENIPSKGAIYANTHELARYAALCQEVGLVPIVEPEVLMDGSHSLKQCYNVTSKVLRELFIKLNNQRVDIRGMILKPNMVVPGLNSDVKASVKKVAKITLNCLAETVPAEVPGIAFLSGGQSPETATASLNAMHKEQKNKLPWAVTFSFSRAIQQPALEFWRGRKENVKGAQERLYKRMKLNNLARRGAYDPAMENEPA